MLAIDRRQRGQKLGTEEIFVRRADTLASTEDSRRYGAGVARRLAVCFGGG